jgi:hypothetical protein
MRNRLIFGTGLAAGYVLGTRAGRARYEALKRAARRFAERSEVQETAGLIQAQAGQLAKTAVSRLRHTVRHDIDLRDEHPAAANAHLN